MSGKEMVVTIVVPHAGDPKGHLSVTSMDAIEKVAPERAERLRAIMEGRGGPVFDRFAKVVRRGAPALAVMPSANLPAPWIAMVVRDPASPTPRLIVLPDKGPTDRTLSLAQGALQLDEMKHLDITTRRVMRVHPDGRVQVSLAGGEEWFSSLVEEHVSNPQEDRTVRRLLSGQANAERVEIPDVGEVRLMRR